jgi:hypothetical protein
MQQSREGLTHRGLWVSCGCAAADTRETAEAALHHEWFLLEPRPAPHAAVAAAAADTVRLRDARRAALRAEEAAWREMYGRC